MVGQQTLDLYAGVRILPPQPEFSLENLYPDLFNVAPSSSGLGHRPLKAKTRKMCIRDSSWTFTGMLHLSALMPPQ